MLTHSKVTSSDRQDRSLIYLVYRASAGSEWALRGWTFASARTFRSCTVRVQQVWTVIRHVWRFIEWLCGFVYCFLKREVLLPLPLNCSGCVSAWKQASSTQIVKHFIEHLAHSSFCVTQRFAFVRTMSVNLEGSQKGQQWLCSSHECTWAVKTEFTVPPVQCFFFFCFSQFHLWTPQVFPNSHQSHVAQNPTNLLLTETDGSSIQEFPEKWTRRFISPLGSLAIYPYFRDTGL